MKVVAYEGVVENGRIQVLGGVALPEKATVYVILPNVYEVELPQTAPIRSPRLSAPSQASFFELKVTEEDADA